MGLGTGDWGLGTRDSGLGTRPGGAYYRGSLRGANGITAESRCPDVPMSRCPDCPNCPDCPDCPVKPTSSRSSRWAANELASP